MNDSKQTDMNKQYFSSLVTMLSMSAIQSLGKLSAKEDGEPEISLEAAQATIDMLDMLEAKTKGNLDKDEENLLRNTLSMLKLNYVETARNTEAEQSAEKPEQQEEAPKPDEDKPAETESEAKSPKFRKRYE